MGTRSLTLIHDGTFAEPFVSMYRHMDGYPSGHGKELYEFLKPIRMVNGIGATDSPIANGAGCLAAQIVAYFKGGAGGIYLVPPSSKDHWQEYEYHVHADDTGIRVVVFSTCGCKKCLFDGSVEAFGDFCNETEA